MLRRPQAQPAEAGFVTLAALLVLLIVTVVGTLLVRNLFGGIQGEYGYSQAVGAAAVAEAGLHWAGSRLTGPSAVTQVYQGEAGQTLQAAGGRPVGTFDVAIRCTDGTPVDADTAGCAVQPQLRLIRAMGYTPSKAAARGRRTVQGVVAQNTFFAKTLCAYQTLVLGQGVVVQGDVGSEGTAGSALSLLGPPRSAAAVQPSPDGAQPGSAYAAGTVACSRGCDTQLAGHANPNQAPGSVCPNVDQVWSTYTCAPGKTSLAGDTIKISAANNTLRDVSLGARGSVTFVTAGPADVLTVNVNSIFAGANTQFVVQGGGIVELNVKGQIRVDQGSAFGLTKPLDPFPAPVPPPALVPAGHLIVRSCSTDPFSPAIWFTSTGGISAALIAPHGIVRLDQAQGSRGAILAQQVSLDQNSTFGFDPSTGAVGFGFNTLLSWQDVP